MNFTLLFLRHPLLTIIVMLGWLFSLPLARAQAPATGTVTGHVFSPTSGEYLRNAEISIQGTNLATVSEATGEYSISNVPAGDAAVVVKYTGYVSSIATVKVIPGATATQNFDLALPPGKYADDKETIKLDAFVVSTEREGNAKAIQDQKESMNLSNIVASETFGNVAEGNIGEFVKNLPGVQMDYVEADARSPRIRGLPAQFTTVTMDGMKMASADGFIQNTGTDNGGGGGAGSRSFGFEQVSMSSIDSIEVNFTTNASQDADSPAGNINLRSAHAYQIKRQQFGFAVSGFMNSEEMYLHRIARPDSSSESMIRPNASFDYANSFFDHRLGVRIGLNESNSFNEQRQFTPSYDATPTAADPRPLVITKITYSDGPKFTERSAANVNLDFKLTEHLSLSLSGQLNNFFSYIALHGFGVGSTRALIGGDGFTSWNNVPITSVSNSERGLYKRTHGFTYIPGFEYKNGSWQIFGTASISKSTNNYSGGESKSLPGLATGGTGISTTGMTVNAWRPADDQYAWTVVQTGGLDWAKLANFQASSTGTPTFGIDGRYNSNLIYQAKLDVKYTTKLSMPTWFQAGAQTTENTWIYRNPTSWQIWNYIGPGGGLGGSYVQFPSAFKFDPGNGAAFISLSGGAPAMPDMNTFGALFKSNPEYFVPSGTAANFQTTFIAQPKYVKEQTDAVYLMANVKPLSQLILQAGVRIEKTRDETKDYDPLPSAKVVAAGFPITASTGVATTIPGLQYQYFTNPRRARSIDYSRPFPTASAKYNITENLTALFGYSYTITRPSFSDLTGTYTVDDATSTISAPNPNLTPQYANNYSARLTYYFPRSVSSAGIGFFENDFKNFSQTQTLPAGSAAQFGFTDPVYDTYTVNSKVNLPGTNVFRGMTLEFTQSLSEILPDLFRGLSVHGNYTRTYTEVRGIAPNILNAASPYNFGWMPGVAPNVVNYGVDYRYRRFSTSINARWQDKTPYSGTYLTYQQQSTKVDLNLEYRFTTNLSIYFYTRNMFDVPDYIYANNNPQRIGGSRAMEYYGAYFYGGIRGRF